MRYRTLLAVSLFSSAALLTGCETTLRCGPTAVEQDGTCVCPTGTVDHCDGVPCPPGEVGDICLPPDGGMGGDGGMDAGEDTGEDPCGGACSGDTPHCDVGSDTCVACLEASHCDASAPVCGSDGTCGACTGPSDCSDYPDTPLCDDGGDGACVACVGHGDCTAPDAAQCDATTHTCVPCDDSTQCTEDGEGICDESGASGVCVECTIDTEDTACGDFSCNPATKECTETLRGDVGRCEPCIADSECIDEHRCIALDFMDEPEGSYCLLIAPDGPCPRPYRVPLTAVSLSGAAEDTYCAISQTTTTCPAITSIGADCPCVDGSTCHDFGAGIGMACTISCGSEVNCPAEEPFNSCGATLCGT